MYSNSITDHLRRLERVLQKVREHGLKIEEETCQFFPKLCEVPWSCGVIRGHGNWSSKDRGNVTMACAKKAEGLGHSWGSHPTTNGLSPACRDSGTTP